MHGIRVNSFLKSIRSNPYQESVRIAIYGEEESFAKIENHEDLVFFNKEYQYSELLNFLKDFVTS
jgi:hypothetical protein